MNQILQGDSLEVLKTLPSESVDMTITSPPYWGLRDYGVDGQLGLEPRFEDYINNLCDIFGEAKRVLKKEGTCWVNIGDTYSGMKVGNTNGQGTGTVKQKDNVNTSSFVKPKQSAPEKSLCMIPFRFAIEMVNRGWILRNTIIWHKPNAMPQSVKDRFTVDFEYLFLFSKNRKYYFEQQYEPHLWADKDYRSKRHWKRNLAKSGKMTEKRYSMKGVSYGELGRNKRSVWTIPTKPYKEAHFAVYPEALCEVPIKAGCPINGLVLDPFFGSGTTGVVAKKLQRNYLGIELSEDYIKIAQKRLAQKFIWDTI